tara:strand:+ start:51 stop:989 length:939 start_codon:yes stop_codon:yes gene_type:complete
MIKLSKQKLKKDFLNVGKYLLKKNRILRLRLYRESYSRIISSEEDQNFVEYEKVNSIYKYHIYTSSPDANFNYFDKNFLTSKHGVYANYFVLKSSDDLQSFLDSINDYNDLIGLNWEGSKFLNWMEYYLNFKKFDSQKLTKKINNRSKNKKINLSPLNPFWKKIETQISQPNEIKSFFRKLFWAKQQKVVSSFCEGQRISFDKLYDQKYQPYTPKDDFFQKYKRLLNTYNETLRKETSYIKKIRDLQAETSGEIRSRKATKTNKEIRNILDSHPNLSLSKKAELLTEMGIKTSTGRKIWTKSSVQNVLKKRN